MTPEGEPVKTGEQPVSDALGPSARDRAGHAEPPPMLAPLAGRRVASLTNAEIDAIFLQEDIARMMEHRHQDNQPSR